MILVRGMEQAKAPAWMYYFDYVRNRGRNSRGAGHGSEVAFVFNMVLLPKAKDREIIRVMQGQWIRFATAGDPNGPGLPQWPPFTAANPTMLVYGQDQIRAERDWLKARFDLILAAIAATWPKLGEGVTPSQTPPSKPIKKLDSQAEQEWRTRVDAMFEALRTGSIEKCIELSDPAVIQAKGQAVVEKYFKSISGLVRFAKMQPGDRTTKTITLIDDKSVKVEIEFSVRGKKQPPAYEVWSLVDGKWYYRETLK